MDTYTSNTRVKVPALNSVTLPLRSDLRTDEASLPKPKGRSGADGNREKRHLLTPKRVTTIGTWNVRTLNTTGAVGLLIQELNHFRWDIIGLSETHWTGTQELQVKGCKILSSGGEGRHQAGVALVISGPAQRFLLGYRPVNERIISARFQTMTNPVTIVQIYAPTTTAEEDAIDRFYEELQNEVNKMPKGDSLIVMGDFNAKVGSGERSDYSVMGAYGIGQRNERGERLIDFCYANDLYISNTKFRQAKPSRCWTWESPDKKTLNQIDFILVSKKLMTSVQNSRAFPSADIGSDHQLVLANIKLRLKRGMPFKKIQKLDRKQLKNPIVRAEYSRMAEEEMEEIMKQPIVDVESEWKKFKGVIQEVSKKILGYEEKTKTVEWLTPETIHLAEERRKLKNRRKENPQIAKHHNYLCREVKRRAKKDKELYIQGICKEIEDARTQNKIHKVYEAIRRITGKRAPQVRVVKDEQGQILTDLVEVKQRWGQYFDNLYNDPNAVNEGYIDNLPSIIVAAEIPAITESEIEVAIKKMKRRKAPGVDDITVEELEAATLGTGLQELHRLFTAIWDQEEIPTEWKHSVIVPIYKKKDKLDCSNYRGISLLCHSSKIFFSIILQRIKGKTEEILTEAQCGFRANRSTIDQIFTLRQLAEKYEEFGKDMYICYIDFRKAFDSVWRKGLWKVMRYYGYPEKIIRILENAYRDTFAAVRVNGDLSDWFQTIVGVLQGCVLSPLLFNIFLEIIITTSLEEEESGVQIGGVWINNLRFADDVSVLSETHEQLQVMVNRVVEESENFGMRVNIEKTEIQHMGREHKQFTIQVKNQSLKQTDSFVYLGGNFNTTEGIEADIKRRISIARNAFQSLGKIWMATDIKKTTKLQVYETLVLSCLLYNSETWTMKRTSEHRLKVFEMTCLRKIVGVTRRDMVRNEDIKRHLQLEKEVTDRIQQRRLRYFGHVVRMKDGRYPKTAMYGGVHGKRRRGRPKKRWMDTIKEDCEALGLTIYQANTIAQERNTWRNTINGLPMHA